MSTSTKDGDICQNDTSEHGNVIISKKRGRKPKLKCSTNKTVNYNTRRSSRSQNSSIQNEDQGKKLKLFPIFNSPYTQLENNIEHVDKVSEKGKAILQGKERKNEMGKLDKQNIQKYDKKKSKCKKIVPKTNFKRDFFEKQESPCIRINEQFASPVSECNDVCDTFDTNIDVAVSETVHQTRIKQQTIQASPCITIDEQSASSLCESNNVCDTFDTDIDGAVSETVQHMCLETEGAVGSDDIVVLSDMVKSNKDKLSHSVKPAKRKRKAKQNICMENPTPDTGVLHDEDILEASTRKRSLRSGGKRNNLINYSEINSSVTLDQQQSCRLKVIKSSNKHDDCSTFNIISNECTPKVKCDNSLKARKSENVKDKLKLFPIFTSNKAMMSNESNQNHASNKRKLSSDETFVSNDTNISVQKTIKNKHRNKRVRNKVNADGSESDEECKILQDNIKAREMSNDENKRSQKFEGFAISDAKNIEILHEECINENKKSATSSQVGILKKSYKSHVENIYYPVLSHINVCNESLPDTVSKFCINSDNSECDITLPVWNEFQGFIDANCIKSMNSKVNCPNKREKLGKDLISASPDIVTSENDGDILWTDSVQNTIAKENNNEVVINEVKSWLLEWKDKFCKKSERKKSHSDSESFSSDSDSDDDFVSNSIIIHGAPGSGKTNLVFSLASELGFTVLEVNASSCRSGRNISNQLKEALESYHMEHIKTENTILKSNQENILKDHPEVSIIKTKKSNKSFFESGKKDQCKTNIQSQDKKQNIANFFQVNVSDKKDVKSKHKNKHKKSATVKQKELFHNKSENLAVKSTENFKSDKNACVISNLTIILIDDIDIVFEEDEGFWSTVKGFLRISKKPFIFTVGRNLPIVKTMLNSDIQIFNLQPISKEFTLGSVKAYCKKHFRENTNTDLELLSSHNLSDLRRNILNAQFWTQNTISGKDAIPVLNSNFVHINSFIVGDLSFSAEQIRKLLFHHVPNVFLNAISQYQVLGYDILHSNLFYILNILDTLKCEKEWQTLTCQKSLSFSDSQMWAEACEIFKLKKKALKTGSCSKKLDLFADLLSDFSFADMLKGLSSNKFQWISVSERIKLWTAGLPVCDDNKLWFYEDILQHVSLINIYALRKIQNANYFKSETSSKDTDLILEHPFTLFDQAYAYSTEDDLKILSTALPSSQQLNKRGLTLDYLSMIKIMCRDEKSRQLNSGKRSGRFLHYFDSISFFIDRRIF